MHKDETTLHYQRSAENFNEALPLGNGRLGAMFYGKADEIIHINEDSVWSGGFRERINPRSRKGVETIRELLKKEQISEAERLLFPLMAGVTENCRHYMPVGDLKIHPGNEWEEEGYERSLDLLTATGQTVWEKAGITRTIFVSQPDQVIVVKLSAKDELSFVVELDGRDDYYDINKPVNEKEILYTGGCGGKDGICFSAILRVVTDGVSETYGHGIKVSGGKEAVLYLSVRTSYYEGEDHEKKASKDCEKAVEKGYEAILSDHLKDYQALFFRNTLTLGREMADNLLPTDVRLERFSEAVKEGKEPEDIRLFSLYYHFGRYLMISGSRPQTLPLNLQGIWNKDMWPAWGGRFTVNINLQMNYWPVEVTNLSECHEPLFTHLFRMLPHGKKVAEQMYGARGFCCHHNTDLWGDCAPQDLWMPATIWPMGAAWLCLHIVEHYAFTGDKEFLLKHYPLLLESSLFFVDYLMENDEGQLVTGPSVSPENTYITKSKEKGSLCIGPSMDSQIITSLLQNTIKIATILNRDTVDAEILTGLKKVLDRLPKPEVGQYGQIKEWAVDYEEAEPGHRHVSQLFALYPGHMIDEDTPELLEAAKNTLTRRLKNGGGHTGWSRAWISCFYARLKDPVALSDSLSRLLSSSTTQNLLDSHPPFQIDGNFGGIAAMAEGLLQSQKELSLLPACPVLFKDGEVKGLKGRGGFVVDMSFKAGQLLQAVIKSERGEALVLRLPCDMMSGERRFNKNTPYPVTLLKGEELVLTALQG